MYTTPKVALVTGASSGFGQVTAARLSAQGFRVFGTSRAPAHNEASSVELLPLDVNSETSVQTCVQTILGSTGRIDLLVNNAGFAQGGALEENSLEDAWAQFDTNVFGVLRQSGLEQGRARERTLVCLPAGRAYVEIGNPLLAIQMIEHAKEA